MHMSSHDRMSQVSGFKNEESGSITIFSLFIFMAMIIFGGIAVDLMLYENKRTHLQASTDRAVLAAANLDQTLDPALVVQDYLAKVGINISQDQVKVREVGTFPVITGRQVSVDVTFDQPTLLMDLVGVDTLPYRSDSEATEAINDIEISLILDISGSMGNPISKLENMQDAAGTFVERVLAGSVDNRVSISLVPYSTQVSVGEDLLGYMNTEHNHSYSHCLNFEETDFTTTAIDHTVALSQTAHFDPWNWGTDLEDVVCRDESFVDVIPWSNNVTQLVGQIEDLTPDGNTSIDVAIKWGAAMLDPSMRGVRASMIGDGTVNGALGDRPFNYDREDTLKFIVVMTDGINTTQYYLADEYKDGASPIYKDSVTGRLSSIDRETYFSGGEERVFDFDRDGKKWNPSDNFESHYWWYYSDYSDLGLTTAEEFRDEPYDSDGSLSVSNAVRMDWLDVWAEMPVNKWAYEGHYRKWYWSYQFYQARNAARQSINAETKEARMEAICDAVKDQGVVIFSVGFEVTDDSAAVMESCASTPSHFYRVTGEEIEYAFASIANQINQLKLTQ